MRSSKSISRKNPFLLLHMISIFFISPVRFEKYHDYTFFSIFEIITKLFQKTLILAFDFFPQVDFFRILAQSIIKYLNSSIIIIFLKN